MKINMKHKLILRIAYIVGILPAAVAYAVPQYNAVDLGSLGGSYSQGMGVNNNGLSVGYSHLPANTGHHAIVGDGLAAQTDLGTLGGSYSEAYGINNVGHVVGSSWLTGDVLYHGFKWVGPSAPPLGPLSDLKALVNPGYSRALAINDNGQVSGFSSTSGGTEHAVKWSAAGIISDLGTLNVGNAGNSYGVAINLGGVVVGYSSLSANKFSHGVIWNTDGSKTDIGTLGGNHSAAYGINALGEITGSSTIALDAAQHAFLWKANQIPKPMLDLGTLGGTFSEGLAIDSAGDVVGSSTTINNAGSRAFLWQSGIGIQDLNSLIDPASGWVLMEARSISEDGNYIAGMGTLNGQRHAFLLTHIVIDNTPPQVSFTLTPSTPSLSGWFTITPSLTWSVTDAQSAVSAKVGCTDVAAIANTAPAGTTFSCTATSAGGTSTPVVTPVLKVDTVAPVLAGVPVAFTRQATSTTGGVVNYTSPTASDVSSGVKAPGVTCLPASGTVFPMGPTTVNCSVSDNAGNVSSASFVVTVADQTPPSVVFNINPAVPSASGWYLVSPSTSWTVTDPESAISSKTGCATVLAQANTGTAGRNLSCTAISAGGTTGPIVRNVKVDIVKPTLTGVPANMTQNTTSSAGTAVTYVAPIAADPTPGSGLGGVVSCLPASGSTFPVGVTPVNCSVSDVAGNNTTASFTVTVNLTDSTPPVVNFQVLPSAPGASGWYLTSPSVTWTVTDPESAITSPVCANVTSVGNTLGQSFSCSATSSGGTTGPISTPVFKVDTTIPTFTGAPGASTVAATSANGAVVTYTAPIAADTFSGVTAAGVSCLPASGVVMPIGNTTVTCSASDVAGNSSAVSFVVTVADQTPPVFSSCPATVTLTQGQILSQPVATDNVSTPVVARTPAGTLGLGTTAVTWTATDGAGLTATCLQQVTVNAAVTETINVTRSQCKRINATSGEWLVQGTSSVRTSNTIQLYSTATVPFDKTTNSLGAALTVSSQGGWQYQAKPGPACISPISLRSSATGKENGGIVVAIQ